MNVCRFGKVQGHKFKLFLFLIYSISIHVSKSMNSLTISSYNWLTWKLYMKIFHTRCITLPTWYFTGKDRSHIKIESQTILTRWLYAILASDLKILPTKALIWHVPCNQFSNPVSLFILTCRDLVVEHGGNLQYIIPFVMNKKRIMHGVEWRTVYAFTKTLFWCLFTVYLRE